jgi:hypothetical protein
VQVVQMRSDQTVHVDRIDVKLDRHVLHVLVNALVAQQPGHELVGHVSDRQRAEPERADESMDPFVDAERFDRRNVAVFVIVVPQELEHAQDELVGQAEQSQWASLFRVLGCVMSQQSRREQVGAKESSARRS